MRNMWISDYRSALRRPTETLVAIDSAYEATLASPKSRQAAPSAEHQALSREIDADIAEIMGIARRSAAYRMHQSRNRLRHKLAHYARPQQPSPKPKK